MKRAAILILVLFSFNLLSQNRVSIEKKIINHLSFLGYQSKIEKGRISIKHKAKPGFDIVIAGERLIIRSWFQHTDYAIKNLDKFALLINAINNNTAMIKFFIDPQKDMILEASYPLPYNKQSFSVFITTWEKDFYNSSSTFAEDLKKYIK